MPVRIPTGAFESPYAGIDYILRNAQREIWDLGVFHLLDGVRQAVAVGAAEAPEEVRRFVLALEGLTRSSRNQLITLHHQLGSLMQADVVAAYTRALATQGRNAGPYRESSRDAGGRLASALGAEGFFRGTTDGILFGNITLLDRRARQWHRLNFGALPNRGAPPGRFEVRWRNMVVGALGYEDQPSAPFLLPRGFFRERQFYPTGPTPIRPTRGIRAWNFLDAGVATLAREVGPAYEGLYGRWVASAQRGRGPLSRTIDVSPRLRTPRAAS